MGAAELSTALGQEAKEWVKERYEGRDVILVTEREGNVDERGKYGRILAVIQLADAEESLNHALVSLGYASQLSYITERP